MTLEDLMTIGILRRIRKDDGAKAPYLYQLKQKFYDFAEKSEIFKLRKTGLFHSQIAEIIGCSSSHICRILNGEIWKGIKDAI